MNEERLIELAHELGARKMVVDVRERCGYPGIERHRKEAEDRYNESLDRFLAELRTIPAAV